MCRVAKGEDERIDGIVLSWFRHMKNDRLARMVYVGSRLEGRPPKSWIDSMNECLKKIGWVSKEDGI